jgi:hypothetical protein
MTMVKVAKNPRRPIGVLNTAPKFPGLSSAEKQESDLRERWKAEGRQLKFSDLLRATQRRSGMKRLAGLESEERLRFLREQLRQGRLSTVLPIGENRPGQGFQLGKRSILGEV